MPLYVDSSVVLRTILPAPQRAALRAWFATQENAGHRIVSSRLLRTEIIRMLRREGLPLTSADRVLRSIGLIALTDDVASVAESIERHTTTLDALHLATALKLGEPATVVTHDQNLADVARHLGLSAIDPVAEVGTE